VHGRGAGRRSAHAAILGFELQQGVDLARRQGRLPLLVHGKLSHRWLHRVEKVHETALGITH